jgi:ribosome-associated toxin RatA of RatAB toxin-antitoxin module
MSRTPCPRGAALTLATIGLLAGSMARAQDGTEMQPAAWTMIENAEAAPGGVTAHVASGARGIEVEGRFRVAASRAVAWAVLTDYEGIPRFVSSMSESRVTRRAADSVWVEQVAVGRLFFFKRRLRTTLEVHEEPPGLIRFEDVLKKDFERYQGEWRIQESGRQVEVVYHVEARPAASIPDFVARGMFQRTVSQLLSELEREVANRAVLAERHPTERSRP